MKMMLYALCLGLLSLACHKSTIGADDLLYRKWQLAEGAGALTDYVTFDRAGFMLYGPGSDHTACCSPTFFTRKDGATLTFANVPVVRLPANVILADCAAVSCTPFPDSWTILILTDSQLVLQTPYGKQVYKPA